MIGEKYEFMHYNGLTQKRIKELQDMKDNYFNNKTLYIKLTDINSGDYFIENGADVRLISSNGNEIIANDGSVSIRNNDFDGSFSVSYTRSLLLTDYEKVSLIGTFKDVPYRRD